MSDGDEVAQRRILRELDRAIAERPRLQPGHPDHDSGRLAEWLDDLAPGADDMSPRKTTDAEETTPIAVRLPLPLVERVDRHVDRMNRTAPAGVTFTRGDALRNLLTIALDKLEADEPKARK